MKRFFSILLCFVLILSAFAGCKKTLPAVRISCVTNSASAPLGNMLDKTKNGFVYSATPVNLPNRVRQAMADGECDIAIVPIDTVATIYKKADPKIQILAGISVGGFELVSTEEIKNLSREYAAEALKAELYGQPEHMHELLTCFAQNIACKLHTRIMKQLLDMGVLKTPTEEQAKGLCTVMYIGE